MCVCESLSSCHCLVTRCVSASGRRKLKTRRVTPPPSSPLCVFPVGRLVWAEEDPRAETRAEGTEGRHLYACWQERERWSRKIYKFQKNTRKKTSGAKIFALSPPYVWHFSVCTCCFSLEVTEKGLGKNEDIFVKRRPLEDVSTFPLVFSLPHNRHILWLLNLHFPRYIYEPSGNSYSESEWCSTLRRRS